MLKGPSTPSARLLQAAPDIDLYEMKQALAKPWLEEA